MALPIRTLRWFLAACAVCLLASCATGPEIRTDYDPDADFSRYHTWAFYQPLAIEQSGYGTFLGDRMRADVRREMEARGYAYDEQSPDVRVNLVTAVQQKTNVYSMPRTDYQFIYTRRGVYAVPFWTDDTQVYQYHEGTLRVDVVDTARKRLAWTGAAISTVSRKSPQQRAAEVDVAIAKIFEQYPYRAGSAQPVAPAK